jgi:hypothetical protein
MMGWMILTGSVIGMWAVLSIVSSERQNRLAQLERQARLHRHAAQEEAVARSRATSHAPTAEEVPVVR